MYVYVYVSMYYIISSWVGIITWLSLVSTVLFGFMHEFHE